MHACEGGRVPGGCRGKRKLGWADTVGRGVRVGGGGRGEEGVGGGEESSLTLRFPRRVPSRRIAGKHRKHPGGRGNAGGQHHHRIMFDK